MSSLREMLFSLLLNASLQIALFALLAKALSGFVARARPSSQHCFYLGVLVVCLALPVVNTFSKIHSSPFVEANAQKVLHGAYSPYEDSWLWRGHAKLQRPSLPPQGIEDTLLLLWGASVLYRLVRLGRGIHRVRSLRKSARLLTPAEIAEIDSTPGSPRISFFASTEIAHPVTIGLLRPAVILPGEWIASIESAHLMAIVAHESAHIRRRDFAVHIACEVLSLPVAQHPGVRFLMSRISQTRELACDEYAAVQLGERRRYARALLRLASLCLQAPASGAVGLGIFDGDNLEERIMRLTTKGRSLSRASLLGLVLTTTATFGSGAVFARAISRQGMQSTESTQSFAGTWNWMFEGKSFATMTLIQNGAGLAGTVTESRIALNDDGTLKKADASKDRTPKQIESAEVDGSVLRVRVADGFEFAVSLKDKTHADLLPGGAPPNMKPIALIRAH